MTLTTSFDIEPELESSGGGGRIEIPALKFRAAGHKVKAMLVYPVDAKPAWDMKLNAVKLDKGGREVAKREIRLLVLGASKGVTADLDKIPNPVAAGDTVRLFLEGYHKVRAWDDAIRWMRAAGETYTVGDVIEITCLSVYKSPEFGTVSPNFADEDGLTGIKVRRATEEERLEWLPKAIAAYRTITEMETERSAKRAANPAAAAGEEFYDEDPF